jgi:Flp pilus assembly protein TadB
MPLTPAQKKVLSALEHQLHADDPALAAALAQGPRRPRRSRRSLLPARQIALLIGALCVLAALGSIVADRAGVVGIGVVTAALIVPWLVTSARAAAPRHDPASTAGPHESDGRDPCT